MACNREFHDRVYGPDFPYSGFGPLFEAELYDPAQWADIFSRAGAQYIVITSKHHDGYALWGSPEARVSFSFHSAFPVLPGFCV